MFNKKVKDTLVLEISRIKMESKENIKGFNKIFTTILNNIHVAPKPIADILFRFYTSTSLITIAMFVKRIGKPPLRETFDEAIKVE